MLTDKNLLKNSAYIDGDWVGQDVSSRFSVTNPFTNQEIISLPDLAETHTNQAIDAANAAWPAWREKTAKERSLLLKNWHALIMQHQEDLATLMTAEQGKPKAEALGEVAYGASFVDWFAEEARRIYGDVIPSSGKDRRLIVIKQPIGVVAAITPWNFPIAMITRKCAPALAAGCTVVVKPSELTPLCALALAELADRAGIPKGVFNVVIGTDAKAIGHALTSSKTVRKLSFTGSTAVGKFLTKECADTMKKVSMELGGNAPFIVFADADIDAAVRGAIASKYRNTGQTCVCTNRFLAQDEIYDEFVEKLSIAVAELKVGDGSKAGTTQGPLINQNAVEKVEKHINDALAKGGKIMAGGKRHEQGGTLFEPTVIANASNEMMLAREETFGPVAPVFKFTSEDEAVAMANDTEFGLAAYFYTSNIGRSWRVAENLEYGIVGINEGIISTELAPFGGVKESGTGREGSKYGIDDFVEIKYMCIGNLD